MLILGFNIVSKAQINFDDLLKIQRSDVGYIASFLTDRNWQLTESSEETQDEYGKMTWAYGVDNYEIDKAQLWLNIKYSVEVHNRLTLQVADKLLFQNIKAKILSYGMKRINSDLKDGLAYSDYVGKNYVVRVAIGTNSETNKSRYLFSLWNREDYFAPTTDGSEEQDNDTI